jgi:hypothetical protein
MPRLLGFTPTKSMLALYQYPNKEQEVLHTAPVIEIIHTGPIIENKILEHDSKEIQSIKIPTYTKTLKLPEMPSEIKTFTSIKRNVNLNPLSDE